jgi:DNA-directed RNA polymerase I, II, and III subunit RPABC5
MLIPVKCFTCGKLIAHHYSYYLKRVAERKRESAHMRRDHEDDAEDDLNATHIEYLDDHNLRDKTAEGRTLDEIGFTEICCRRHFMTHVDIY